MKRGSLGALYQNSVEALNLNRSSEVNEVRRQRALERPFTFGLLSPDFGLPGEY